MESERLTFSTTPVSPVLARMAMAKCETHRSKCQLDLNPKRLSQDLVDHTMSVLPSIEEDDGMESDEDDTAVVPGDDCVVPSTRHAYVPMRMASHLIKRNSFDTVNFHGSSPLSKRRPASKPSPLSASSSSTHLARSMDLMITDDEEDGGFHEEAESGDLQLWLEAARLNN